MQTWFVEWIPVLGVALLSGIFNLIVAYAKFDRDIRSPFFTPLKSIGFWLWLVLQLSIPAIIFWVIYGPTIKAIPIPDSKTIAHEITLDLITKAITLGIGFTAFVNSKIDLGFAGLSLHDLSSNLTKPIYQIIARKQNRKLAGFTTDLELELTQPSIQLTPGLNYLRNYFQYDFALKWNPIEQQALLDRITQAGTDPKAITSLILEVRSRDSFETLKRFGCRDVFLQTHFLKQTKKQKQIPQKP
jgi:hypothetical protein